MRTSASGRVQAAGYTLELEGINGAHLAHNVQNAQQRGRAHALRADISAARLGSVNGYDQEEPAVPSQKVQQFHQSHPSIGQWQPGLEAAGCLRPGAEASGYLRPGVEASGYGHPGLEASGYHIPRDLGPAQTVAGQPNSYGGPASPMWPMGGVGPGYAQNPYVQRSESAPNLHRGSPCAQRFNTVDGYPPGYPRAQVDPIDPDDELQTPSRRPSSAGPRRPKWDSSGPPVSSSKGAPGGGVPTGPGKAKRSGRPSSAGISGHRNATQTPVGNFLRLLGIGQYSQNFKDLGFEGLESLSRLEEDELFSVMEQVPFFPGHKAKLIRGTQVLREASLIGVRETASKAREEKTLFRLCQRNEILAEDLQQAAVRKEMLQEENQRLLHELALSRSRNVELEQLVRTQADQVGFLAEQLQRILVDGQMPSPEEAVHPAQVHEAPQHLDPQMFMPGMPPKHSKSPVQIPGVSGSSKTKSQGYGGTPVVPPLPISQAMSTPPRARSESSSSPESRRTPGSAEAGHLPKAEPGGETPEQRDSDVATWLRAEIISQTPPQEDQQNETSESEYESDFEQQNSPSRVQVRAKESPEPVGTSLEATSDRVSPGESLPDGSPEAKHAEELQQLPVRTSSMNHANGITSKFVLVARCLASALHKKLLQTDDVKPENLPLEEECKIFASEGPGPAPNRLEILEFIIELFQSFSSSSSELAVLLLVYLDRFTELSSVSLCPENWRLLVFSSAILASKVWDGSEAFTTNELAQLSPFYSAKEIQALERVFLRCVGGDLLLAPEDYERARSLLQSLTEASERSAGSGLFEVLSAREAAQLREQSVSLQASLLRQHLRNAELPSG